MSTPQSPSHNPALAHAGESPPQQKQRLLALRRRCSRFLARMLLEGGDDLAFLPLLAELVQETLPGLKMARLEHGAQFWVIVSEDGDHAETQENVGRICLPVCEAEPEWTLTLDRADEFDPWTLEAAGELASTLGHLLRLRPVFARKFGDLAQDFGGLVDATREISRCETLDDLYRVVAHMGHRLLNLSPTHFLCLERYSAFEKELTIVAVSGGPGERLRGLKLSTDPERMLKRYYPRYEEGRLARELERQEALPLTGTLVSGERPYVLVHDVQKLAAGDAYYQLSSDTRSEIAVPILLENGGVWGILNVESPSPYGFASGFDLPVLGAFARLVSVFIRALAKRNRNRTIEGMVALPAQLKKVIQISAQSSEPVLITGETGTGKEVVARLLHNVGRRRKEAFIPVNCGALEQGLLMNELFGHSAHSYTGAGARDKGGLFHAAHQGTIFLDEIENMPMAVQEAVLRVLDHGEVRRVGGTSIEQVDVRILAATNVDLRDKIADGSFRLDLYYRLKILEITIPPLRERRESIPALVEQFIGELRGPMQEVHVDKKLMSILMTYQWPGNVRELKNAVKRMLVFSNNLTVDLLPEDIQLAEGLAGAGVASQAAIRAPQAGMPFARPFESTPPRAMGKGVGAQGVLNLNPEAHAGELWEATERALIVYALKTCAGDRYKAAHLLGVSPPTIYRKIKKYGIEEARIFQ